MNFKVGDRVILKDKSYKPAFGNHPFGMNSSKKSFMDGETVYTIKSIVSDATYGWRIKLDGVHGLKKWASKEMVWSFNDSSLIMAERIMNKEVFNILKGERV